MLGRGVGMSDKHLISEREIERIRQHGCCLEKYRALLEGVLLLARGSVRLQT